MTSEVELCLISKELDAINNDADKGCEDITWSTEGKY